MNACIVIHTPVRNEALDGVAGCSGALTHISIPLGDITTVATTFMTDYGIASYDAAHAASAIAAGAEVIVTIDTAFALLPSSMLMVYTDRSRVASCRSKRPR